MNLKSFPYLTLLFLGASDLLLYLYVWFPDFFLEDHLIENLQVFFLSCCCFVSFMNIRKMSWFRYRLFSILAGFGCLFLILEETSYGQRLLGFTPSDFFLQYNDSREINLHNIHDGTMEAWMNEFLLYWAVISFLNDRNIIKRLISRWIPSCNTEKGILTFLLFAIHQSSFIVSDTFPEGFELLWYLFFLTVFLSQPKQYNY